MYKGPKEVAVEEVEPPRIEDPRDAVVKMTSMAICGSDRHMHEARTGAKPVVIFGHENMGVGLTTNPDSPGAAYGYVKRLPRPMPSSICVVPKSC